MSVENVKYIMEDTEENCNFLDEKLWKLSSFDQLLKETRMIKTISVSDDTSG